MSDGNETLRNALRTLSLETRDATAAPRVKDSLMKEMRRRQRSRLVWKWWPALALAALVMGVWLGYPKPAAPLAPATLPIPTEVVQVPPREPMVVVEPAPLAAPQVARPAKWSAPRVESQLSPLTPWYVHPGLPQARQGHVVYMQVGPETARLFGLSSTGPLQAEVFLGDDGLARAIRLVRTTQIARGE